VTSWLSVLPHRIPFRAASTATRRTADTIEGTFLCTGDDASSKGFPTSELMVLEAMAQLAGGLAFHDTEGHGYLSGIDHWEIDRFLAAGDVVKLTIHLEATFGGLYRFGGTGCIDDVEVVRGRFYLASPGT
jgi:3-hydroxymyristoyl/3-hydroxydecanoyl-(acyl carrier protein) dehydratase